MVACAVTQEENDLHQLEPMLLETKRSLAAAGIAALPRKANADAGYRLQDLDIEALEHDGACCGGFWRAFSGAVIVNVRKICTFGVGCGRLWRPGAHTRVRPYRYGG